MARTHVAVVQARPWPAAALRLLLAAALVLASAGALGWLAPPARADGPTTFSNTTSIAIPATGSPSQIGPASPYPSTITVSGMSGTVSTVTVTFSNLTHGSVGDIDAMLVSPTGRNLVVLSDIGAPASLAWASNATLTFSDSAAGSVPAGNIPTGTYRPTNTAGTDSFPAPAPSPSSETTLTGAFAGMTNANGTWSLYVVDDATGDIGTMAGGWSLTVTTTAAAVGTTTAVTSSDPTTFTGDPVTFTATVTAGGTPVTSGSVQFAVDGADVGAAVPLTASGTALLPTSALAEGTHVIRATYGGATGFLGSNGTVSQRVDNRTVVTGTTFCNTGPLTIPGVGAAVPYPSNVFVSGLTGTVVSATATLKGLSHTAPIDVDLMLAGPTPTTNVILMSDAGGQTPASNVTLTFDDAAAGPVPAPLVSGTFRPTDLDPEGQVDTFPAPAPAPSSATALSTFAGSSPNGAWSLWLVDDATGDTGSVSGGWCLTLATTKVTATTLTSSLNPSTVGDAVTFTATVTSDAAPVTVGSVVFTVDGAAQPAVPVGADGVATFTTSALAAGSHTVAAGYQGSGAYLASSDDVTQVVEVVASTTVLTSSLNPSTVADAVTFTATVTAGGAPVTAGSVVFTVDGTAQPGVSVGVGGTATFTTSALAAGTHTVEAAYSGTASVGASDDSLDQVVDVVPSSTALTSSLNPSTVGDAVTFTATVTAGGAPVTAGSVVFTVDGAAQPAVSVGAGGTATFTTSTLALGAHAVEAAYSGTASVGASDDSLDQVVGASADAGGPYVVAEGDSLTLDGSGSTAGAGATYGWDLDADGSFTDATGATPTVTWAQLEALGIDDGPATHPVALRVTDGTATDEGSATLAVENTAPTSVVTGSLAATVGVPFTVKVGADDPSSADLAAQFTYTVDWGDGSPVETVTGPADPPVTHTYAAAGPVTASFTATDKDGGTGEPTTVEVAVSAAVTPTPTQSPTATVSPTTTSSPTTTGDADDDGLAQTGSDLRAPLVLGILLVIAGGCVVVASRLRRRPGGAHR